MSTSAKPTMSTEEMIAHYQRSIEKSQTDPIRLLHCLGKLYRMKVTVQHLQATGIGRTVNALRKDDGEVGVAAKSLVAKWKAMVAAEESSECSEDGHLIRNHIENADDDDEDTRCNKSHEYNRKRKPKMELHYQRDLTEDNLTNKSENDAAIGATSKNGPREGNRNRKNHINFSNGQYGETLESRSSKSGSGRHQDFADDITNNREKSISQKQHPSSSSRSHRKQAEFLSGERNSTTATTHIDTQLSDEDDYASKVSKKIIQMAEDDEDTEDERLVIDVIEQKQTQSHGERERISKHHHHLSKAERHDRLSSNHKKAYREHHHLSKSSSSHKNSSRNEELTDPKTSTKGTSDIDYDSKRDHHHKRDKSRSDKEKSSSSSSSTSSKRKHESKMKTVLNSSEEEGNSSKRQKCDKPSTSYSSSSNQHKKSSKSSTKVSQQDDGIEIDHSMGTSFADALGMIMPSGSKSSKTKHLQLVLNAPTPSSSKSKSSSSIKSPRTPDDSPTATPVLLTTKAKLPPLEDLNVDLPPTISNNYKPMPLNPLIMDCVFRQDNTKQPQRLMTDEEMFGQSISSKNMRTKVYSGVKSGSIMPVPSLHEMCLRILQKNIDALEYTGGVPFEILKPVMERATPDQLLTLEHYNPYLMDDSDSLWQLHCSRKFRGYKRREMETWREMYARCTNEQEKKLSILTENIKHSQIVAVPLKQTKLCVDSMVKPPRNVIKKQTQFGTERKLVATPAARVSSLSNMSSNIARVGDIRLKSLSAIRDTAQVAANPSALKGSKKAPLMAKTLQLMKGRFKR